jgi:hypothetical protein
LPIRNTRSILHAVKYSCRNGLRVAQAAIEQKAERAAFNVVKLKETAGKVLFDGSATARTEGRYLR